MKNVKGLSRPNMPFQQKFSNNAIFERRERELENGLRRKPGFKKKLNTFYLTERPIITENDKLSTLQTVRSDAKTNFNTYAQTEPEKRDEMLLKQIENSRMEHTSSPKQDIKSKTLIEIKTKALNRKKESVTDFINKTREIILMKYTSNIKKERAVRLKETFENEIESINDTIKSLKQAKQLFNDTFYVKFGDYVKHLSNQKEIEKTISANLLEEIIHYKNEISQIQAKIKKQELDKSNLIHWLYFQIKVKEKMLVLPSYYRNIIEDNNDNSLSVKKTQAQTEGSNTSPSAQNSDRAERSKGKKMTKRQNLSSVSVEEVERIKKYKYGLVFETPDDFLAQLKKLEMDNINLLDNYNELRNVLRDLTKEKDELLREKQKEDDMLDNDVHQKEKELTVLKERCTALTKEIENLNNNHTKPVVDKRKRKEKKKEMKNIKAQFNKAKLFAKILQLHKTTVILGERPQPQFSKKITSTEGEMLNMLKHIELNVDGLLGIFQFYHKNQSIYREPLKKIKGQIEKEHKIEKAKKQHEEQNLRMEKLKEQVEERNSKIYFRPRRKVDMYYEYVIKKEEKDNEDDDSKKEPLFTDFMYDIFDDDKLTRSQSVKNF